MKVRYFAWVRERVGKAEEDIDPPDGIATVGDLVAWLTHRGEGYAYAFENPNVVRSAIDKRHVHADARIAGASEIAFFPSDVRRRRAALTFFQPRFAQRECRRQTQCTEPMPRRPSGIDHRLSPTDDCTRVSIVAKCKKASKVQKRAKLRRETSAKLRKARKAAPAKRTVAKAKPKRSPVKKAARKVKRPVTPVVETVAVEVIEQPAPGVITVTEVEETPGSGLQRALKRMNPNR